MFEFITLFLFLGLIAFVAGVYSRVVGMSFGFVVAIGLYSIRDLIPIEGLGDRWLTVILATSLVSSLPINLFYLSQSLQYERIDIDTLVQRGVWVALIAILVSQLAGIIPLFYLKTLFTLLVVFMTIYYLAPTFIEQSVNRAKIPIKIQHLLFGGGAVLGGNEGKEIIRLFASSATLNSMAEQSGERGRNTSYSNEGVGNAFAVFIAFSACVGFAFPALPLTQHTAEFVGYIHLPAVFCISVIGMFGVFTVRSHDNLTDSAWLQKIFAIFLLSVFLKEGYIGLVS